MRPNSNEGQLRMGSIAQGRAEFVTQQLNELNLGNSELAQLSSNTSLNRWERD